jgi:hypothetical protein
MVIMLQYPWLSYPFFPDFAPHRQRSRFRMPLGRNWVKLHVDASFILIFDGAIARNSAGYVIFSMASILPRC